MRSPAARRLATTKEQEFRVDVVVNPEGLLVGTADVRSPNPAEVVETIFGTHGYASFLPLNERASCGARRRGEPRGRGSPRFLSSNLEPLSSKVEPAPPAWLGGDCPTEDAPATLRRHSTGVQISHVAEWPREKAPQATDPATSELGLLSRTGNLSSLSGTALHGLLPSSGRKGLKTNA